MADDSKCYNNGWYLCYPSCTDCDCALCDKRPEPSYTVNIEKDILKDLEDNPGKLTSDGQCQKCLNLQPVFRICSACGDPRKYYCKGGECWEIWHATRYVDPRRPSWFCPACSPETSDYRQNISIAISTLEAERGIQAEINFDLEFFTIERAEGSPAESEEDQLVNLMEGARLTTEGTKNDDPPGCKKVEKEEEVVDELAYTYSDESDSDVPSKDGNDIPEASKSEDDTPEASKDGDEDEKLNSEAEGIS